MELFWICDENSVDNTGMFSLLFSRAYTEAFSAHSRPFLLLAPPARRLGGARNGVRHRWDSWPQLTQEMFQTIWHRAQHIKLGEEGTEEVWSNGVCFPKSPLCVMEPCFPGNA